MCMCANTYCLCFSCAQTKAAFCCSAKNSTKAEEKRKKIYQHTFICHHAKAIFLMAGRLKHDQQTMLLTLPLATKAGSGAV